MIIQCYIYFTVIKRLCSHWCDNGKTSAVTSRFLGAGLYKEIKRKENLHF